MKELIKITEQKGSKAVSARELYQFLQVKTQFKDWIVRMLEYGFVQNIDYQIVLIAQKRAIAENQNFTNSGGDRKTRDYALTIGCAKEICMLQRTPKGKEARLYFIEKEKEALALRGLIFPKPKVYNGVKCVHYISWLLQNGYSLMSGRVRARIKQYPQQFRKGKDGWYMSEEIARYFLDYKHPEQRIQRLPSVHPNQLKLFN